MIYLSKKEFLLCFAVTVSIMFCCGNAHAKLLPDPNTYLGTGGGGPSTINGFVINAVHNKLYLTGNITTNNLITLDLNPDSGALNSPVALQVLTCTSGMNVSQVSMALDAMRKKLYIGVGYGNVYIYDLSDTGMIIEPYTMYYSHKSAKSSAMNNMYIDFVNNLLVSSGWSNPSPGEFIITRLDNNGMPAQDSGTAYPGLYQHTYVAVSDINRSLIYAGHAGNSTTKIPINSSGIPQAGGAGHANGGTSIILDSANKRLYFSAQGLAIRMWRLNELGVDDSMETLTVTYACAMAMDPVRRKLFVGGNYPATSAHIAYYDMDSDGKLGALIDTNTFFASGYTKCMAYEPFYNKVYVGTQNNDNRLLTYQGPDSAMVPIVINSGETLTESPYITLKLRHANPAFIYVSGDLLSIGGPVTTMNKWLSCGGDFWKNTGDTTRASTLNVSATLSPGIGNKTIEVWYCGSTTGLDMNNNFTGMMRKATATISLIEASASVLSMNVARIDYTGARIDYTAKDPRERSVSITAQYRTSDKEWTDLTLGSGGDGTTNLPASSQGTSHYLMWDIEKDISENARDVQLRMKANNGDTDGAWLETAKYSTPDWTGSDLRVLNVSIKKTDGTWSYRTRLEWIGVSDTSTDYEIQKKEDDGNWAFIGTTTGTIYEVENLSDSFIYSFKLRLRTKEGLFSAYSKTVRIKLAKRQYGTSMIGKNGGRIFIEDFDENDDNNPSVEIEPGTFENEATVTLERFSSGQYEINGKKSGGMSLIPNDFKKAVTLKLAYNREEITEMGWQEDDLAIYHFDGVNWLSIGGKIDKINYLITAKVNHFSAFKVAKNVNKAEMTVIPECFSPNSDGINDLLYFYFNRQDMVEKSAIRIYDINGKMVKVIKSDGSNTLYWNGRDENDNLCETGIYICVIESGDKKFTATVRLAK